MTSAGDVKEVRKLVRSMVSTVSPIVRTLEWLITLLPRRLVWVDLAPLKDVEIVDRAAMLYVATGPNPLFRLEDRRRYKPGGWYLLEASLKRASGDRIARLFIDRDTASKEPESVLVPSNMRGAIQEVVHLPEGVSALRWQPTAAIGPFNQTPLLLHHISGLEAVFRMGWRVFSDLWRLRHLPPQGRANLTLRIALTNLPLAYAQTACIRRQGMVVGDDYAAWLQRYAPSDASTRAKIAAKIASQARHHKFSVILTGHYRSRDDLEAAIVSVRDQFYPTWELFLAGEDTSGAQEPGTLAGITAYPSMVAALKAAAGDFVVVIPEGDRLSADALFWLAETALQYPGATILYSDNDRIAADGQRHSPYFKGGFDPELLRSQDYLVHVAAFRRDVAAAACGEAPHDGTAAAWDLALRCVESVDAATIVHVPRVLCHRAERSIDRAAAVQAMAAHLARGGIAAEVVDAETESGTRVRYAIPDPPPLVTLIIPTRNQLALLRSCIDSILQRTTYPNYEIIIVDNGSDDPATLAWFAALEGHRQIRVCREDIPFNYSTLNNRAVAVARGSLVGLINNDIEVIAPEWLSEMVGLAIRPGVGAVGARLWYPNDTIQHGGVIMGISGCAGHAHKFYPKGHPGHGGRLQAIQSFSAVTAACLVVSRQLYLDIGGLNERDLAVSFNDIDFCLRLRAAGYRNLWTPFADLYHHESMSRGVNDTPEKRALALRELGYMRQRWGDALTDDPAYSPNLTSDREDFSYAWPPRVGSL